MSRYVPLRRDPIPNEEPSRTLRLRAEFVGLSFVKGVTSFSGKLSGVTGFVGGSALTYALFVADLELPWAIVVVVSVIAIIFMLGAWRLWDEAYRAAWRFAPTWETCLAQADTLTVLTDQYRLGSMADATVLDPKDVRPERRNQFKGDYLAGHMAESKLIFERAHKAGYTPDFDRERLSSAELEDVIELADALRAAGERWRADAESGTWKWPPP